jgi:phosphate:Na+ symporter
MTQWFELLGGLGIFLLGVVIMTDGLKGVAGDALRSALTRFTRSPYSGAATGAISTAILQSSSAMTLAAVGFVGAGLLTFSQALGIVFGANIGTTITGWLVALLGFKFDLDSVVMPLVLLGVLMHLLGRGKSRQGGMALAGFGLIFVGITAMQSGMSGLEGQLTPETFPPNTFAGRLQLLAIGVLITLVTQSSSAGVATALTAVHTGTMSFEQAAAMVIGMDVGTTATALFATIGGSVETRRTGYSHVVYNLFTGVGAFLLLSPYVWLWQWLAPGEVYQQAEIALVAFHSSFNALGIVVILPFSEKFAALMMKLVPDRDSSLVSRLDRQLLADPMVALEALRVTLQDIARAEFYYCLDLMRNQASANPERLAELGLAIDKSQRYLDLIHSSPERSREWQFLMACMHSLDHMGRLHDRLFDKERAQLWQSTERLFHLGGELDSGLRELRNLEQKAGDWSELAVRASVMAQACEEDARRARELMMSDIAQGREDTVRGELMLESSRWLRRVAEHVWRISHYLGEAGGQSQITQVKN